MAPPLVPPRILRPAHPLRGLAAVAPEPALAPVTLAALAQATRPAPAVAAREAAREAAQATPLALVPVVAVAPVEVAGPAVAPAINQAEVDTKSRFGGE